MGEATDRPDSPNVLAKWARASRENCSRDLEPVGLSVAKPHWMVDSLERVEASDAVLPLPAICLAALRLHHQAQAALEDAAGRPLAPATSAGPSRHGLPRPGYVPSPSMGPAIPAGRCWPPWTSTPASPCRSCDTARSPYRWRSTPTSRPISP